MKNRGILLIVMTGILTLLLVLAVAFTSLSRMERSRTGSSVDHLRAKLLARSGVEYSIARLLEPGNIGVGSGSLPPGSAGILPASPEDDWRYRDDPSVSLEDAHNPSFNQDPYTDLNADGRFSSTGGITDPYPDPDGNGRYDGFSGRLRGSHSAWSDRFKLRIEDPSGKISVNGNGTPSEGDRFSDLNENGVWDDAEPFVDRQTRIEDPNVDPGKKFKWKSHHRGGKTGAPDGFVWVTGRLEPPNGEWDSGDKTASGTEKRDFYMVNRAYTYGGVENAQSTVHHDSYWKSDTDHALEQYPDGHTESSIHPTTGNGYEIRLTKAGFIDTVRNGVWDPPEPYTDINENGGWDDAEPLEKDWNGNGRYDPPGGQQGLRHLLNTLGEIVGARIGAGNRLLDGLPFETMDEVSNAVGEEDFVRIAPFITLYGRPDPKVLHPPDAREKQTPGTEVLFQASINRLGPLVSESRVPVSVNTAKQEVVQSVFRPLEALFLRRGCQTNLNTFGDDVYDHVTGRIEEARMRRSGADALSSAVVSFREGGGRFSSWRQWESFVRGGTVDMPAGENTPAESAFHSVDTFWVGNSPVLTEEEAALVNANGNPNARLNKFNPNTILDRLIDKSDLTVWTTEWSFKTSGWFDVSSLGDITGNTGAVNPEQVGIRKVDRRASCRIDATMSLWDLWRDTTQRDFSTGVVSENSNPAAAPSYRQQSLQVYPEPNHGAADWDGCILLATHRTERIPGDALEEGGDFPLNRALFRSFSSGMDPTLLFHVRFEDGLKADYSLGDRTCYPESDDWHPGWPEDGHPAGRSSGRPNEKSVVHPDNPGSLYPDGVYSDWRNVPAYAMKGNLESEAGGVSFWVKPNYFHNTIGVLAQRAYAYWSHTFCSFTFIPMERRRTVDRKILQLGAGNGTSAESRAADSGRDVLGWVASPQGGYGHYAVCPPTLVPGKGEWMLVGGAWDQKVPENNPDFSAVYQNGTIGYDHPGRSAEGGQRAGETDIDFSEVDGYHRGRFRLGEIASPDTSPGEWRLWETPACVTIDEFSIYGRQGEQEETETGIASNHIEGMHQIWERQYLHGRYYNQGDAAFTSGPRAFEPGTRFLEMCWTSLVPSASFADHRVLLDFFDGRNWLLDRNGDGILSREEERRARVLGLTDEGGVPLSKRAGGTPALPGEEPPPADENVTPADGLIRYRAYFKEDANWLTTPLLESPVLDDVTITYVPPGGPKLIRYSE